MAATLVYRSYWSKVNPLVYSDDCNDDAVNKFIDTIFKARRTNRLVLDNNKVYYKPSDDYKKVVVRIRKFK